MSINNSINSFVDKVGQWYYTTLFNWDKDNRLKSVTYDRGEPTNVNYNYDYLGRLSSKSISKEENASIISTSYDFNSGNNVEVKYQSYVVGKGKLPYVEDGVESGTTGQNAGIEALKVKLENPDGTMKIGYEAHIKNIGWVAQVYDDAKIGNEGQGNTIEAIKITLIGAPTGYHVQYAYSLSCMHKKCGLEIELSI